MKKNRVIILILAILFSIIATWNVTNKDFSRSDAANIYSPAHILTELVIFGATIFLIVEAHNHIKSAKKKESNINRYTRILIAVGIIVVHLAVLLHGGYA